ncbi:flagellar hook-associated protein FlgK [Pseudoflavonifractor sp. 524-17]|uniref:flagellar hook-associated protein FlgK n=1 Tax=Pseudoflavonifractor sp. 524-17 TaxID=2304577 RepID=UPI00137A7208|nr:flagellar basal body rod C-terminal domain-containing protein [Pseudoflavonifractor sp. 524-17]NCE65508.1 flagellar hook-associated protein FlgK [Pseudoflavonifractor sp. 524-17]
MSNMGTFGAFTQSRLGIYAAMKGLTVTGNNISNINTPGYTRQVVDQVSLRTGGADRYQSKYGVKVGNGALVTGLSQIRDPYLDIRYRTEMADVGYQDSTLGVLDSLAHILDEVGDGEKDNGIIQNQLNDLSDALRDLGLHAGEEEYERLVRVSANNLCTLLNGYADKLETLKTNTENALRQDINDINNKLTSIRDLNAAIRKSEIHGDDALEMRDERNRLIDELSQYMKIDVIYSYEDIGAGQKVEKLTIKLGDANPDPKSDTDQTVLVDGVYCAQITTPKQAMEDDGVTPKTDANGNPIYLDKNGNEVTDPKDALQEFNENYDITVSRLEDSKGRVLYNTDDNGKKIPSKAVKLDDNDLHGSIQAVREMLTEKGEFASENDLKTDKKATIKRGIPFYQNSLDLLARQIAKQFNDLNEQYKVNEDGFYIDKDTNAPIELNGNPIKADHTLTKDELALLKQKGVIVSLFSNRGDSDDMSGITAGNISVSQSWSNGSAHVLLREEQTIAGMEAIADGKFPKPDDPKPDDIEQSTLPDNVNHMISLVDKELKYDPQDLYKDADGNLLPGLGTDDIPISTHLFSGSFQEMLNDMCTTLGDAQRATGTLLTTSYNASVELNTSRDSVSGVDLNDEAMNMMQYQKAYTAACRMMTAIDEAIERLISNTGIAGR